MNNYTDVKILIVEDNFSLRRTITDILRTVGVTEIIHAEDGKVGLKRLRENDDVDLIMLDWDMPVMTGIQMLRELRSSNSQYSDLPVLMLTAHGTQEDVIEAIQAGASDYIVKPFTPQTVYNKLKKLLKI
ncbi:response regulator [Maridesulfovibrio sp.]|uniref:response regulator n=1 Tax=Maridesulfovibrio sp. TaxID=2795000 RepID=UPI003BAB1A88